MPCITGQGADERWREERNDHENRRREQEHLAMITGLLCEACHLADEDRMSVTLRKWWEKHKLADRLRQERQDEQDKLRSLASQALSKLTTEEVEALRHDILSLRLGGTK